MQKKEFTSFDVAAVVYELANKIINTRVNNIYQVDDNTLLFKLRNPSEELMLILEAGKRIHLTSYSLEKPTFPPAFCMALRKHLKGGLLVNIWQHEFEREVVLQFRTGGGEFKLFLELFSDGNIILVNGENKIVQALRYKRMKDRAILRGEIFRHPPPSGYNPRRVEKQAFIDSIRLGDKEIVRVLARSFGVGGVYAEEILLRCGIDKKTLCKELEAGQIAKIYDCLQELISKITSGHLEPNIIFDENGEPIDVTPLKLERYKGLRRQEYTSFNEALDEFYTRKMLLEKSKLHKEIEKIKQEIGRLERVAADQEKVIKETEKELEKCRKIGDLIYQHSGQLQVLIGKILESEGNVIHKISERKKQGLEPYTFFESIDANRQVVNINIDGNHFSLYINKSIFENAANFYEKAKNLKRKLDGAKIAYKETLKKIEELKAKLEEIQALDKAKPTIISEELEKRKIKAKKWFEKFRWFISSDGYLVVAGKDATTNEVLIKKYTKQGDIVFHADIVGSPFVVIKTEGKTPSEQCLREAAEFAAAYSRAWREGFAAVDVYWVSPEQLSKTGHAGEYVPHGAFVVQGKRNWVRNTPLRIAIGAMYDEENNEMTFIGGPVDAVKAKTKAYVIITPGDVDGKNLSAQILRKIAEKIPKEQREKLLKEPIEKITTLIPFNKGRLLDLDALP
ncbi:MAG: ribosome rescue protein RqcH [Candidatus Bathyarchaeia archaeon]